VSRVAKLGVLQITCMAGLGAVAPAAHASCPPFDFDRTAWAVMAVRGGPSPADREAIMKGGIIPGVPVGAWPPRGPAPLRVGISWVVPPEDPQAIEFDADGDGKPEIVDTRIESFGHTYDRPGRYAATIRVRDQQGVVTSYPTPVEVVEPKVFEAELQARWTVFKAALKRGDLDAALECMYFHLRDRVKLSLEELLRKEVEGRYPAIRLVRAEFMMAEFATIRPAPGQSTPTEVLFVMDMDGVWRLARFGDIGAQK
jgi:hypothetical protein